MRPAGRPEMKAAAQDTVGKPEQTCTTALDRVWSKVAWVFE